MQLKLLRCFLLLAACCSAAEHVVVIGIDGLGGEALRRIPTPVLSELKKKGSWTVHARGVIPTVSSPNWASMINGAGPAQHGIVSNEWTLAKHEIEPVCHGTTAMFPTMFDMIRQAKPTAKIGIFHHWDDFARLVERGAPNRIEHFKTEGETMDAAIAWWKQQKPALLFVHLDHVDHAGHEHGWTTPEYKAAVEAADRYVGQMVDAIANSDTVLIITADHGGVGKKHGGLTMEELEIPWFAAGPGIRKGIELRDPVNTYDTAATVASLLGVKPHACWIGKPVREAMGK